MLDQMKADTTKQMKLSISSSFTNKNNVVLLACYFVIYVPSRTALIKENYLKLHTVSTSSGNKTVSRLHCLISAPGCTSLTPALWLVRTEMCSSKWVSFKDLINKTKTKIFHNFYTDYMQTK